MSLTSLLESFKDSTKIILSNKFMGDNGAKQLAAFLGSHRKVQYLEIKSNDITSDAFIQIFQALSKNQNLRHLNIQYNCLGQNQYSNWEDSFQLLLKYCNKLERLNISNNKITNQKFNKICKSIAQSKSLRLLQIKHNNIQSQGIDTLTEQLKNNKNQTLLYVQTAGNKIKKDSIQNLEKVLKVNRQKTPISKDKLQASFTSNPILNDKSGFNPRSLIPDKSLGNLSKENIIKHLEDILDQNRKDTTQMKIRLQKQLQQLQKRQKNDAKQLNQLDNKCSQLLIANRNLKFELDRTTSQHQQIQRDQQYHMRIHQEKLREANKQLSDLQAKYIQIQNRMDKDHQMKMKQIARQWENRLRSIQQKIRMTENQNTALDNEIKKQLEKKQRLRVQYLDEENIIRSRVQEDQAQKYALKIGSLQTKLREIQESRQQFIRRNHELLYEIQKTQASNLKNIQDLQNQQQDLKSKEDEFMKKNKDFINRNQKLKSDMKLRQITIEKLQQQINRLNQQIQVKKSYNRQQISQIVNDSQYNRNKKEEQKQNLINKLNQLEGTLRTSQLQNAKLRQQYAVLAQKLQIGLGKAVQQVFTQNSLY